MVLLLAYIIFGLDIVGYLIANLAPFIWLYSQTKLFRFMNIIGIWNWDYDNPFSVYTLGLLGFKKSLVGNSDVYMMQGFSGIIIKTNYTIEYDLFLINCNVFYFGSAICTIEDSL